MDSDMKDLIRQQVVKAMQRPEVKEKCVAHYKQRESLSEQQKVETCLFLWEVGLMFVQEGCIQGWILGAHQCIGEVHFKETENGPVGTVHFWRSGQATKKTKSTKEGR